MLVVNLGFKTSVVDPNTLNLDPDPGFWTNLDSDPDPGFYQCCGSASIFMRIRIQDPKNVHMDPDPDPRG